MEDVNNEKILVFGGGTGMSCLLRGLKTEVENSNISITSVVSVCDDGGSTGILRNELDMLAVGDIRKVLVALSKTELTVEKLLNYRFKTNGTLNKHTVGNIMLAALTEMTGSVQSGIELLSKILNLEGRVMPVTESNVTLVAEMEDSSFVEGEHYITTSNKKIKKVFYKEKPIINDELVEQINQAGLIVLSMGSLYTSLIPCLLSEEVISAIDNSNAPIVYVCNLFTQPGETDKFKVSDHINAVNSYLGKRKINTVIANNGEIDKKLALKYSVAEQKDPVELDLNYVATLVDRIIVDNLVTIENNVFRHDTDELGPLLVSELRKSIRDRDNHQNRVKAKRKMIIETNKSVNNN